MTVKAVVSRDEDQLTEVAPRYHVTLYDDGVKCGEMSTTPSVAGLVTGAFRTGGIDVLDLTDIPEAEEPAVV